MQVALIAVGKLKEKYWREALAEYAKRLSAYVRLELVEVADEPTPDNPTEAQRLQVLDQEATRMEKHLRDRDGIIVLDIQGKAMNSEDWSRQYESLSAQGFGRLVFIIGGSMGVAPRILQSATLRWSLGPITLPHQLARIVLVEQIYRGIKISRGEPYHK